jgi:hypothetical protein
MDSIRIVRKVLDDFISYLGLLQIQRKSMFSC